ncbi:hypothetical protein DWV00_30030 [Trinickia dinghuensis]|uniref:Uncharacterized protein n=1 Tax=Trinickia dinghuensis TaxID=2291023 RepID=A0A3D8JQP8_9BURK|nr:hypothetical protein DWV00_30030 [Trinickia dinghuensis]
MAIKPDTDGAYNRNFVMRGMSFCNDALTEDVRATIEAMTQASARAIASSREPNRESMSS